MTTFSRIRIAAIAAFLAAAVAFPASATLLTSGTISIDGTETITGPNRVFRDGVPSVAGTPKAFPGVVACVPDCGFRTVTVTPTNPQVTVTITGGVNGINVFGVGYQNTFSAASLPTNYIGDAGSSTSTGNSVTFSVTVPPGSSFVLAFMNITGGSTGTVTYSISDGTVLPVPASSPLTLAILGLLLAIGAWFTLRKVYG